MAQMLGVVFNILVGIGIPLGVLVWLLLRRRSLLRPFFVGVLCFLCSQLLTRVPLLQLLGGQLWFVLFFHSHPVLYAILLGLSAALFEEIGRLVAMLLMWRHRGYSTALAFGMGHGGLEASMIGLQNVYLLFVPAVLLGQPAWLVPFAGVERLLAMAMHVGWSVLVMRTVERKNPLWLLLAIALHTLADSPISLLRRAGVGTLGIELWFAFVTAITVVIAVLLRPKKPPQPPQTVQPTQ